MPRPTSKILRYLYDRFIGNDPERIASYEAAKSEEEIETKREDHDFES